MSARPSRWSSPRAVTSRKTPPPRSTIDYEPLPAVSDARDAVKPGAPGVHADLKSNVAAFVPMTYGDVDGAFATRRMCSKKSSTCIAARR